MKNFILTLLLVSFFLSCKDESKSSGLEIKESVKVVTKKIKDSVLMVPNEIIETVVPKTIKQLKKELSAKGFKTFDYVDKNTKDSILMQQYFLAYLKIGPIHGQNEEETADLQNAHMAHLKKMYDLGYVDISGPFGDEGDLRGVTVYNVPTLKMADSLANSDPMVISGRLDIEIHPWWVAKGFTLP